MGILEEVNSMKNKGMQDSEISKRLQEKGFTPKSIEDAFNQIRIKNAVSAEYSGEEGMEPSIMKINEQYGTSQTPQPPSPSALYTPKTQEIEHDSAELYSPQAPPIPQFNEEIQNNPQYGGYNQNYNSEEYFAQEGYSEPVAGGMYDTDTIIEIAEQVFYEKIKREQKQIESLNEFATIVETRITNDHERIRRIEEIIDKLQIAILEKIGSYGRNLESIKNEMGMMQESFEKMVPILHEKQNKEKSSSKQRR